MYFSASSCFDVNYDRGGTIAAIYEGYDTPEACQSSCQTLSSCDVFILVPSTRTCYLKNSAGSKVAINDRISGPKYCNGNEQHFSTFLLNWSLVDDFFSGREGVHFITVVWVNSRKEGFFICVIFDVSKA